MSRVRTIVADPPWAYADALSMSKVKRSAASHYQTMSVDDIIGLGGFGTVAGFRTFPDAFLFLWVTNAFLLDGSGARVCQGWGFEPRQILTWVKGKAVDGKLVPQIGLGHFTRGATEHLLLATRGTAKDRLLARNVPNVFLAPRTKHSRKPDAAYALIERLAPGPYVELFAREPRNNWLCWGNELKATA